MLAIAGHAADRAICTPAEDSAASPDFDPDRPVRVQPDTHQRTTMYIAPAQRTRGPSSRRTRRAHSCSFRPARRARTTLAASVWGATTTPTASSPCARQPARSCGISRPCTMICGTMTLHRLDQRLRAFDVENGRELWSAVLPAGGKATPMTYVGADGRQYIVIAAGGDGDRFGRDDSVVAFALP